MVYVMRSPGWSSKSFQLTKSLSVPLLWMVGERVLQIGLQMCAMYAYAHLLDYLMLAGCAS